MAVARVAVGWVAVGLEEEARVEVGLEEEARVAVGLEEEARVEVGLEEEARVAVGLEEEARVEVGLEEDASADAPADAAGLAAITVVAGDQEFLASLRSALDGDELACRVREVELPVPGSDWVEQEGLLYIQGGEEGAPLRLYIPEGKGLRQRVLQEVHDAGHAGHPGRDRTLARLRPRFYWPNMAEYVREYVLTCPSCQMSKARRGAAPGLLQPLPIPGVPWEVVGMDFIGPLPETPDGKDFILTCVCLLTKMVKLVPMRRPDAEGTARAFNERVLSQMGWPRVVVSDRDPKFMSAFWQRLMQLMRTRLNTSTAYHPQTDGQAERMNRLVGEVLRHFVCADQTDWDELLPMVEFAINSSPNRSTGFLEGLCLVPGARCLHVIPKRSLRRSSQCVPLWIHGAHGVECWSIWFTGMVTSLRALGLTSHTAGCLRTLCVRIWILPL